MSVPNPHRFGDPVKPADVVERITAPEVNFGDAVAEATPYYYGRFKALVCAFNIMGELMDRPSKKVLCDRLAECHALTKQLHAPQGRDVEEAGNYLLLLATAVKMGLD